MSARDWRVCGVCGAREARGRYKWRMAARAREAETSGGACDVFSGRSWLGFAWDWLFCHVMLLLW